MIRVTAYKNKKDGSYKGFTVKGHSDYSGAGTDIVCAAVSALVITTVNSLETLTGDAFIQKEDREQGLVDISFEGTPSEGGRLLVDSMLLGIAQIAEESRENVKLSYREV